MGNTGTISPVVMYTIVPPRGQSRSKVSLQLLNIAGAVQGRVAIALPVQNLKHIAVLDGDCIDTASEKIVGIELSPHGELRHKVGEEALHIGKPKGPERGRG